MNDKIMKREQHSRRHQKLDTALSELVADYLANNTRVSIGKNTILDLIIWSSRQVDSDGPDHEM